MPVDAGVPVDDAGALDAGNAPVDVALHLVAADGLEVDGDGGVCWRDRRGSFDACNAAADLAPLATGTIGGALRLSAGARAAATPRGRRRRRR